MRVGIVGTGVMGSTHAAAWARTPATIAAFFSKSLTTASALAVQFEAQVSPDLESLLEEVDVVDICAPTHRHYELVMAAAAAGKNIVCEKPLARTAEQGREMIAACHRTGVKLLVAHVVRYFSQYALARQKVADGEIGRPAVIRLKRGAFPPQKAEDNWFADDDKSGGLILDLMIHDFDYARWVAGDVASVYARNIANSHHGAAVDHALAILTHHNGALTHVEGSWAYPPPLFRTQLEIAGSNGLLRYDSEETAALQHHWHQTTADRPDVPMTGSPLHEDPYATQISAFYAYLSGGTPPVVSAEDGLAALEIAQAAIESAATDKVVRL